MEKISPLQHGKGKGTSGPESVIRVVHLYLCQNKTISDNTDMCRNIQEIKTIKIEKERLILEFHTEESRIMLG